MFKYFKIGSSSIVLTYYQIENENKASLYMVFMKSNWKYYFGQTIDYYVVYGQT